MPLHPALVHLPLGLAFALPILASLAWSRSRGEGVRDRLVDGAWFFLAFVVVVTALASSSTGESLGESMARDASPAFVSAMNDHDQRAHFFVFASIANLVAVGTVFASRSGRAQKTARILALLLAFALPALGVFVGHLGGRLVHELR
jgi:uncharacterized membrane protein